MPATRLPMRKLREIFRLKFESGLPHRAIATACGTSLGAVSEYLQRFQAVGLSWPVPDAMDDAALDAALFPPAQVTDRMRPLPDLALIHQELKRKGVTLLLLWMEYAAAHPDGYRYSQFCELYRRWAGKLKPSMRQIHRAGEKAFVDFAGTQLPITDRRTGAVWMAELFVGVLGASSYTYAEALPSQELPHWIDAHVHLFEFFGGCPEILVPDNLKSGVTKPCRYEPLINRTYQEMARWYGAVAIPARSAKPKDKAKVEAGVLLAERWLIAALRNRTFFSLAEANAAIRELLPWINERVMKELGVSRRDLFERLDRAALRPLPATRYELAEWCVHRVNIDYHVQVEYNAYSVPHQLIHEQVDVRLTATVVEIFHKARRVASHARLTGRGRCSTERAHMPKAHQAHLEWTPSRLIRWAQKTGPAAGRVVTAILESRPHPEQGFRACLGLLRLGRAYGAERLEAACVRAERLQSFRYQTVKNILSAGLDREPLTPEASAGTSVMHDNIRGASYYAPEEAEC